MNTLIVLALILIVVMVCAYQNARWSEVKTDVQRIPSLKKEGSYMLESQILTQLALQKAIQKQHQAKRKVSVHLEASNPELSDISCLLERLAHSVDFYFIMPQPTSSDSLTQPLPKSIRTFTYKSTAGCLALVRQLAADVHIETSWEMIKPLKPFVSTIITTHEIIAKQSEEVLSKGNMLRGRENLKEILAHLVKA